MKLPVYKQITLKNGLSIIMQKEPMNSVSITIAVGAGSRYETTETTGTAHFLEHMLFEGSRKFPNSKVLSEFIENVGGKSSAWTYKEHVAYQVKIPKQHLETAFKYLEEILFNSTLSNTAIQKEKKIILEEIKRTRDTPEIDIWDQWFEWVWGKVQPMGRSTLGNEIRVKNISRTQLRDYLSFFYHPANMAIAIVGNFSSKIVENYAKKFLGGYVQNKTHNFISVRFNPKKLHTRIIKSNSQQTNLILGFVTNVSYTNNDRFIQQLIADILSAGMSSRLYQKLIYQLGIAYSAWSQSLTFLDTGQFVVFGGFSPQNTLLAIKTIIDEIKKLKLNKISEKELMETKEKAKANLIFALETPEALANWYASQQITEKKIMTIEEYLEQVDQITPEDIMKFACKYFLYSNVCLSILGPDDKNIVAIEKLLKTI